MRKGCGNAGEDEINWKTPLESSCSQKIAFGDCRGGCRLWLSGLVSGGKKRRWQVKCLSGACVCSVCPVGRLQGHRTARPHARMKASNNNNNNRIQRRYSRFFTISSQRREPSPTHTFKWPGRNRVQITCNTSSAYHVQVSCYVPLGTKGQLSYYV